MKNYNPYFKGLNKGPKSGPLLMEIVGCNFMISFMKAPLSFVGIFQLYTSDIYISILNPCSVLKYVHRINVIVIRRGLL